jgi:hypothetical protein
MKKLFMGFVVLSMVLVMFSGQALAASATARAELDLTSLLTPTYSGFTWTVGTETRAGASDLSYTGNTTTGWAGPLTTTWTGTEASAKGNVTGAYFTSNATTYEPGITSPTSYAYAGGGGTFSYSGSAGLIHFSIPYTFTLNLSAEQGPSAWAYGDGKVWVYFRDNNGKELL